MTQNNSVQERQSEQSENINHDAEIETIKDRIRELSNSVNCLQDRYRKLTGRFYSGGA